MKALRAAGATVDIVAPAAGKIQGMRHRDKADKIAVDRSIDQVKAEDYDALVLPAAEQ